VELDPWGADTNHSSNSAFQPKKFTSYERDNNGTDEAMFRPTIAGSRASTNLIPTTAATTLQIRNRFNRYAYVQGDPVNFVDPSGLLSILIQCTFRLCIEGPGSGSCTITFFETGGVEGHRGVVPMGQPARWNGETRS